MEIPIHRHWNHRLNHYSWRPQSSLPQIAQNPQIAPWLLLLLYPQTSSLRPLHLSNALYNCRAHSTNRPFVRKTNPISENPKSTQLSLPQRIMKKNHHYTPRKNKPNQTQFITAKPQGQAGSPPPINPHLKSVSIWENLRNLWWILFSLSSQRSLRSRR